MTMAPHLRRALVDWMLHHPDVESMPVTLRSSAPAPPGPDGVGATRRFGDDGSPADASGEDATNEQEERWSVGEVLYALWDDATVVPDSVSGFLGLPARTTYGHVARLMYLVHAGSPSATWADVVTHVADLPHGEVARLARGVGVEDPHARRRVLMTPVPTGPDSPS